MLPRKSEQRPPTPKGRDTRQRILAAARTLFGEKGYSGVRITDITEAADLSPGAFYRYFEDRRDVVLVLLRDLMEEAFDFVRAPLNEQRPIDSVLRTTQLYFEFYHENRALFSVLVELGQTDPEVGEIWAKSRKAFYSRIAHALSRGVAAGRVRADVDVEVAAEMLGSMTEFYAFQRYVLGGNSLKDVPAEEATRVLSEIWTTGIRGNP